MFFLSIRDQVPSSSWESLLHRVAWKICSFPHIPCVMSPDLGATIKQAAGGKLFPYEYFLVKCETHWCKASSHIAPWANSAVRAAT